MRAVAMAVLFARRVRAEAAILLLLFVLVAMTSFLFAAAPRLLNRIADDGLRSSLDQASTIDRDLRLNGSGYMDPGTQGGVTALRAYGQEREADLPASVSRLVADRYLGVSSVRFAVERSIVAVTLRYQDGVTDDARLVAGRWPVDRGVPLRLSQPGEPGPGDVEPAIFEVALSSIAAETIDISVGERLAVDLDTRDTLVRTLRYVIAPMEVEIVGIYEPIDPAAGAWAGSGLIEPTLVQGPAGVEDIFVTGLFAADAYPNIQAGVLPFRFDWHYQLDAGRLDADQVDLLQADMRRLELSGSTEDERILDDLAAQVRLRDVSFGSGLVGILDDFTAQRARSASVLLIAALGPLCLAAAAIAMIASLLVRQRRSSLLLVRGRGASGALLLGAQLFEAIVLAGSAALLGLLTAVALVPARETLLSPALAAGVAGATTLLLLAATWPTARRPLTQLERDDPGLLRVAPRRLVIEATVVVLALVAVVLLRQRGLSAGLAGTPGGSDPLLVAVPVLAGLAAGIVAMRLFPLPVRALGWLAARRRDLVPVIGLRTVARYPASANLSLLVLMLAAAFGSFASVVEASIIRGQVAASYEEVGADYRLESTGNSGLPAALDPTRVAGVESVATGVVDARSVYVSGGSEHSTINLNAIDARAHARVTAGTAAAYAWPSGFVRQPPAAGSGTDAEPIPAIVSADFPPGREQLGGGDTFSVDVSGRRLVFELLERRAGFPGLATDRDYLIVPLDWLTAALATTPPPTVIWLRASDGAASGLAELVSGGSFEAHIISRPEAFSRIHDAPLVTAVADGFRVALLASVAYLAITLVGAVIMSAAGRTRDLAYLRSLGISSRQALGLIAVEHAPPVIVAIIPGVLLGVGLANTVEPGLGLAAFMDGRSVPLSIDWPTLGLVVVALSAVVALAIGLGTWLAARVRLVSALRIEDK